MSCVWNCLLTSNLLIGTNLRIGLKFLTEIGFNMRVFNFIYRYTCMYLFKHAPCKRNHTEVFQCSDALKNTMNNDS